jgi:hypothetical protein
VKSPLVEETKDGIVATLLPVNTAVFTKREAATVAFVQEWFFVDLSMPESQDTIEKLAFFRNVEEVKKCLSQILKKSSLIHYYQIPFLRLGEEATVKVDFVEINPKRRLSPERAITPTAQRGDPLTSKEMAIIQLFKEQFFRTISVPSWEEAAGKLGIEAQGAKNHMRNIGEKAGICHNYQVPFIRLPN